MACPTGQHIRGTVAGEGIIQAVAGAVDHVRPGEGQLLDIGAQREAHAALDMVRAFIGLFHHRIACAHDVGVVACPTGQHIRGTVAPEDVGPTVPSPVDCSCAKQRQVLEIGPQGPGHVTLDRVRAFIGLFHHRIARAHHVNVVSKPTGHAVHAGSAIEDVIPQAAMEQINAGIPNKRI